MSQIKYLESLRRTDLCNRIFTLCKTHDKSGIYHILEESKDDQTLYDLYNYCIATDSYQVLIDILTGIPVIPDQYYITNVSIYLAYLRHKGIDISYDRLPYECSTLIDRITKYVANNTNISDIMMDGEKIRVGIEFNSRAIIDQVLSRHEYYMNSNYIRTEHLATLKYIFENHRNHVYRMDVDIVNPYADSIIALCIQYEIDWEFTNIIVTSANIDRILSYNNIYSFENAIVNSNIYNVDIMVDLVGVYHSGSFHRLLYTDRNNRIYYSPPIMARMLTLQPIIAQDLEDFEIPDLLDLNITYNTQLVNPLLFNDRGIVLQDNRNTRLTNLDATLNDIMPKVLCGVIHGYIGYHLMG